MISRIPGARVGILSIQLLKWMPLVMFLLSENIGCTYVSAISTTNIPASRAHKVTASTKRYIFFQLVFDNDEILELPQKLREKCPEGAVRGITTQNLNTLYFLDIFWAREVVASGYCVKASFAQEGAHPEEVVTPDHDIVREDGEEEGIAL